VATFLEIGILGTDGFSLSMIKLLSSKESTIYNLPYEKENKTNSFKMLFFRTTTKREREKLNI